MYEAYVIAITARETHFISEERRAVATAYITSAYGPNDSVWSFYLDDDVIRFPNPDAAERWFHQNKNDIMKCIHTTHKYLAFDIPSIHIEKLSTSFEKNLQF